MEIIKREKGEFGEIKIDFYLNKDRAILVTIEQLAQGFCYKNRTAMLTAFDDEAFTQHMDRIIVFSREEIGFVLKCGITLRERM